MDPGHVCCGGGDKNVVLVAGCIGTGFHQGAYDELLLIGILEVRYDLEGGLTKSYFPTTSLNFVAKHSAAVPSSTDFSNSAKNFL